MTNQIVQHGTEFSPLTQVTVNIQVPSAPWHNISQPQAPSYSTIAKRQPRR
jgi:hypothetical protein